MALVDAVRTDDVRWQIAKQSKPFWIVVIVILGILGTALYAGIARPALRSTR